MRGVGIFLQKVAVSIMFGISVIALTHLVIWAATYLIDRGGWDLLYWGLLGVAVLLLLIGWAIESFAIRKGKA